MTGDLHNIDDLFTAGLEGKEEVPEEKVWNAIEQDLDKIAAISIREKYVRLRRASAILLILLLGVSIYAIRNTFIGNSGKTSGQQQMKPAGSIKNQSSNATSSVENGGGLENSGSKSSSANPGSDKTGANSINKDNDASIKNSSAEKSDQNNAALSSAITKNQPAKTDDNGSLANGALTDNNSSTKNIQGATRDRSINALSGGAVIASAARPGRINSSGNNKNRDNKNKTSKGNNDESLTNYRNTSNNGIENSSIQAGAHQQSAGEDDINNSLYKAGTSQRSSREMAMLENTSSRQVPATTAKISSANALSDAVKSNPANNLSIPVKNRNNDKFNIPGFSITPMASLNLMSNKIENDLSHPGSQGNEKYEIEETESEKLSYTFSLLFDVKIARRMTIQTGIGYMQKTTAIDPKEIGAVRTPEGKIKYQFDCSAGRYYLSPKYGTWPRVGDSAYTIASANQLHYITVPLAVKYYFGKNKLNFYAIAGADANFLLGQDLTTGLYGASYYGKKTPPKPIGLNNVFVNAILGGGINYSLNRWLGLTFSPTYRFALNPINKDMSFKAYPRNLSLAGGLRFSF